MRKRPIVFLTEPERERLHTLIGQGAGPARALTHARILLKANQGEAGPGWTDQAIADALEVHPTTVARVRQLYDSAGLDAALDHRALPMAYWILSGLAVATLLATVLALVLVVPRLYPPLSPAELRQVNDPARRIELDNDRRKLQNDARTTFLQGLGGLAVLTGAYVGYRQLKLGRETLQHNLRTSRKQHELDQQGQITERFSRAIDHLGNQDRQLDVILGGIYALERIARDSSDDRATIAEVLCAYTRGHALWPPPGSEPTQPGQPVIHAPRTDTPGGKIPELTAWAPDIQAAVTVLGRGGFTSDPTARRLDLHDTDLRKTDSAAAHLKGADLHGAHLDGAKLGGAHLERADLHGAHLDGADLGGAHLDGANLASAHLDGANLKGADLRLKADLRGARLDGADLRGARLEDANLYNAFLYRAKLRDAHLERADLHAARLEGAYLEDAKLGGAHLGGAKLSGARLEGADLKGAIANEGTRWPDGIDRQAAEARGVLYE